jgi:signal transduction histidine kinase
MVVMKTNTRAHTHPDNLERQLAQRTREVAALSRIAQALAGALDLQGAARAGLRYALDITDTDAGEILLWDADQDALVQLLQIGAHPEAFAERRVFGRNEGVPGEALHTRRVVVLDGVVERSRLVRPGLAAAGFRTVIAVPLRAEDRDVGVMQLAAFAARTVGPEMEEVLLGLGGQVGTALDRARAYERERALRRRLEALNAASLAIAGELSLPALLQRITDTARELTDARYAALGVVDAQGRVAEFITSGISPEERVRIGAPPCGRGLLGLLQRGTTPVRIPNIAAHPAAYGFPPNHPPMTSFLGVPIVLHGRNLGNLYLTDKHGGEPFTEDDERLLVQLAAHAAVAIEHARLYGQTSESLQQRVTELNAANEQLAYLSSLAISAQEEERRRLARELHDDTAQALASVLIRLRVLERTEDPQELRARLHEFREVIARALDDVRRMAIDLRPSTLDDLGLVPALESHARAVAGHAHLQVRVTARGIERRLPPQIELVVYRIVQEALSNIAKHAAATEVDISLRREGAALRVTVHDNGRGFDVGQTLASRERGLGLFGMQERAALVGGRVDVRSAPGQGTTVTAIIPIPHDTSGNETRP